MGKNHTIKFMTTREQKERILAKAQQAGKSLSEYLRELALNDTQNLYTLVNNTNEIVRRMHDEARKEIKQKRLDSNT